MQRDKRLIDPATSIVTTPDLSANQSPGDRAPRDERGPWMPDCQPVGLWFELEKTQMVRLSANMEILGTLRRCHPQLFVHGRIVQSPSDFNLTDQGYCGAAQPFVAFSQHFDG